MDKDPSEILIILFDAVIEIFYFRTLQKTYNALLKLPAPLTGDDFDERDALTQRFLNNPVQFRFYRAAVTENIMEIKFYLCHGFRLLYLGRIIS